MISCVIYLSNETLCSGQCCRHLTLLAGGKYSSYAQILPSKIELPSFFKHTQLVEINSKGLFLCIRLSRQIVCSNQRLFSLDLEVPEFN